MNDTDRPPEVVLKEMVPMLSLLATRRLYAEQPNLWTLGEHGRARTLEDFNHHFNALAVLEPSIFRSHVQYCEDLFRSRGFPHRWLADAWRWMERVMRDELPPNVAQRAIEILRSATTET